MSLRTFILSRWWHTLLRSTICLPACFSFVTVLLFAVYDCMSIISVELCSVSFLLSVLWHYCLMSGRASRMSILKLLQQSLMVSCLPAEEVLRHSFWSRQYFHCCGLVLRLLSWSRSWWYCLWSCLLLSWSCVSRQRQFTTPDDWWDASLKTHCHYQLMSCTVLACRLSGMDWQQGINQTLSLPATSGGKSRDAVSFWDSTETVFFTVLVLPWSWDVVFWS